MIANILESENHAVHFPPVLLPTLFVENIGYNNFKYIAPLTLSRRQPNYTVHFILSGKGRLNIEGDSYLLSGGDIFFCPPGALFSYWPEKDDPWEYVWFALMGSGVDKMFDSCGFTVKNPIKRAKLDDAMRKSIEELFTIAENNSELSAYAAARVFLGVVETLYESQAFAVPRMPSGVRHVERAERCIAQNYQNPDFKVEHIGRLIFVSHSYLCRLFLAHTGKTLVRCLIEYRLNKAKELLKTTELSVKEVGETCGYADYSHFCKMFDKEVGQTPTAYRAGE